MVSKVVKIEENMGCLRETKISRPCWQVWYWAEVEIALPLSTKHSSQRAKTAWIISLLITCLLTPMWSTGSSSFFPWDWLPSVDEKIIFTWKTVTGFPKAWEGENQPPVTPQTRPIYPTWRLCQGVCSSKTRQLLHQRLQAYNTHSFKWFYVSMWIQI